MAQAFTVHGGSRIGQGTLSDQTVAVKQGHESWAVTILHSSLMDEVEVVQSNLPREDRRSERDC